MQSRLEFIFPTMEELLNYQTDDLETTGIRFNKEDEHVFKKPKNLHSIAQRIKILNERIQHLTSFKSNWNNNKQEENSIATRHATKHE